MTQPPDNLGPLQPDRKPRKAAKVALVGLLAAAGLTADALFVKYYDWDKKPTILRNLPVPVAGDIDISSLRVNPPANAPASQPGE